MTVKDAAEMTGRTEQSVRRWITEGRLKAEKRKYQRAIEIKEEDFISFCKEYEIDFVKTTGPDIPDHPPQRITQ
jgi:hypothetical protein